MDKILNEASSHLSGKQINQLRQAMGLNTKELQMLDEEVSRLMEAARENATLSQKRVHVEVEVVQSKQSHAADSLSSLDTQKSMPLSRVGSDAHADAPWQHMLKHFGLTSWASTNDVEDDAQWILSDRKPIHRLHLALQLLLAPYLNLLDLASDQNDTIKTWFAIHATKDTLEGLVPVIESAKKKLYIDQVQPDSLWEAVLPFQTERSRLLKLKKFVATILDEINSKQSAMKELGGLRAMKEITEKLTDNYQDWFKNLLENSKKLLEKSKELHGDLISARERQIKLAQKTPELAELFILQSQSHGYGAWSELSPNTQSVLDTGALDLLKDVWRIMKGLEEAQQEEEEFLKGCKTLQNKLKRLETHSSKKHMEDLLAAFV